MCLTALHCCANVRSSGCCLGRLPLQSLRTVKSIFVSQKGAVLSRCHALLPTGAGPLLTGGSDRCIRLWDAAYPQQSYIVAGPPAADSATASSSQSAVAQPPVSYKYLQHTVQQVSVVDEVCRPTVSSLSGQNGTTVPSYADRAFAQSHRDTVKYLLPLYVSEQLLLSASQDGVIKAWK